MTIVQSILLGILQGIAEFLPISSSGHLKIAQALFGLSDVPLLFDVFLHLATLLAVVLYFRKKILSLLLVFCRWITLKKAQSEDEEKNRRFIIAVIVSTIITGVLGIVSSKIIPDLSVKYVCAGFLVTSALLIISAVLEKRNLAATKNNSEEQNPPNVKQALFIGFMQGVGTLPGISRSGSTIAGALLCKVDRQTAGEYSFIVSIPAILGAFVLEAKDLGEMSESVSALTLLLGCVAAFVAGFFALAFLMKLIKKGKLEYFAFYLIPVAILGFIFL